MKKIYIVIIMLLLIFVSRADEKAQQFWNENNSGKGIEAYFIKNLRFTPCAEKEASASALSTVLFQKLGSYHELITLDKFLRKPLTDWIQGFYGTRAVCCIGSSEEEKHRAFFDTLNIPLDKLRQKLLSQTDNLEQAFIKRGNYPSEGEKVMMLLRQTNENKNKSLENLLSGYMTDRMMEYTLEEIHIGISDELECAIYAHRPVIIFGKTGELSIIWGIIKTDEGVFFAECTPSQLKPVRLAGRDDKELKRIIEHCKDKSLREEYSRRLTLIQHCDLFSTDKNIWDKKGITVLNSSQLIEKMNRAVVLSDINFYKLRKFLVGKVNAFYIRWVNKSEDQYAVMRDHPRAEEAAESWKKFVYERAKYEYGLTDEDLKIDE